ncbi:MAG: histidine kinase, partial [Saprospiraceae bacterium]
MQGFLQRHRNKTLHLLFWSVYFSFFFYQISNSGRSRAEDQPFLQLFNNALSHTIYLMIVAYLNYFLIMPRFLRHKNGIRYTVEFVSMAVVILFLYVHAKRWIVDGYTYDNHFYYSNRFAIGSFVTSVLVSAFVALLRFFSEWRDLEDQRAQLKNEKLVAELKFLKNQINPHFLFNTLNNLYALAYSNSPQTTEVISRLSQMMRYMVYDSNYDQVPLEKEIEYMRNYISLEKLRLNDQIPIEFEVTGDPENKQIAPLLLIPFLENSFKHGISNNNKDSWVKAILDCNHQKVTLHVSNSKTRHKGT